MPREMLLFALEAIWLLMVLNGLAVDAKRLYVQQFPSGSEHLGLPEGGIIAFSIYLGKVGYAYMSLTLESMRWNGPLVQFVLINVVEREDDAADLRELLQRKRVDNFHLEVVTCAQFSRIVQEKLGISVPFNSSWYYKMTDYKPTLATLFPHIIDSPPPLGRRVSEKPFAYWGYVDTDLVWGNFSRFSSLFRAGHSVVTSDYQGASGVAMFFSNDDWGRSIFRRGDPLYSQLLALHEDFQLDEFSRKGKHSNVTIDQLLSKELEHSSSNSMTSTRSSHHSNQAAVNADGAPSAPSAPRARTAHRGLHWKDKLWLESHCAHTWAGPVRWFQGSLQIVHASPEFPAGREILIFHRPTKEFDLNARFPRKVALEIEADMMTYGYLLPNWVPLLTRHLCVPTASQWQPQSVAMDIYRPYDAQCFAKHNVNVAKGNLKPGTGAGTGAGTGGTKDNA